MVDMEALFAEMRKAQTGGVDFAARETKAAAAGDDESDSDTSDTPPGDSHLLPKAMEREETRYLTPPRTQCVWVSPSLLRA